MPPKSKFDLSISVENVDVEDPSNIDHGTGDEVAEGAAEDTESHISGDHLAQTHGEEGTGGVDIEPEGVDVLTEKGQGKKNNPGVSTGGFDEKTESWNPQCSFSDNLRDQQDAKDNSVNGVSAETESQTLGKTSTQRTPHFVHLHQVSILYR